MAKANEESEQAAEGAAAAPVRRKRPATAQKPKKERERTINFFEIVKYLTRTSSERMKHANWVEILGALRDLKVEQRIITMPSRTLIGEVLSVDGVLHLKLMVVRDEGSWLEVYNTKEAVIDALKIGNGSELLETSIIAFLPFGNVIGLVQGSTSAPTVSAFEEWLNGMKLLGDGLVIDTQPMVSHEVQQLLTQSQAASKIEVKVHTNKADALASRGSKLTQIIRAVRSEFGPMTVTVILQVSRAAGNDEGRAAIRDEAQKLVGASENEDVKKVKANLVYIDQDETTRTQEVDFAKQKITAKRKISTTGEDGSPIRNEEAVRVILEVAEEHDAELRKIVEQG
ncbi:hypothetical protein [Rathayibacter sp. VKM Ac-2630]|uniref:hypothetical protein n=1 Tax=Rathayibacter sp. VKM Ac-2630 TaxID=1938617 RepID=UPI00098236E6|nr:hypothetical protein [Rathayibacter sp. VKM Ac-2630]OOB90487.1 hypothetical protein B0T42_11300 [Rathayibacter sp. VKM Ac-2630]